MVSAIVSKKVTVIITSSRGRTLSGIRSSTRASILSSFPLTRKYRAHVSILVIADVKTTFPELHLEQLKKYIARGGNLLIAAEPKRQEAMNPITELFGVKLMEGRLVKPDKEFQADLLFTNATRKPVISLMHLT